MRFVAHDQIECRHPVLGLRLGNHLDRLVGGKDDSHRPGGGGGNRMSHLLCIGSDRERQVGHFQLRDIVRAPAPLADLLVRTHREGCQWQDRIGAPLPHRLSHQRQRWHQE